MAFFFLLCNKYGYIARTVLMPSQFTYNKQLNAYGAQTGNICAYKCADMPAQFAPPPPQPLISSTIQQVTEQVSSLTGRQGLRFQAKENKRATYSENPAPECTSKRRGNRALCIFIGPFSITWHRDGRDGPLCAQSRVAWTRRWPKPFKSYPISIASSKRRKTYTHTHTHTHLR